mmetsp:Transcript_57811/g.102668  ORF Transcript_57811/g.102668 Transcript_57811/m.102668 type:complete len:358 (-) Transcript_57811:115-1188(-)|eukprot:CAMPEP_0197656624 /NCGR_PEP_ID=MMETSP1338-20131121/42639_1 /TAXON_ID=43686 ORGANISM="Pelagodinium beii, Strain RCC1491" /NCGR_SAMPLE_ID=MMETSP1338 /ASSEMBLY_ACC=CAM_ASM_000754 /LENGTH=357 /DNA_ID=CAMNT_0043232709 /DNA_START=56 /DNA_END=1129 /DNA_ORIENTATION=-
MAVTLAFVSALIICSAAEPGEVDCGRSVHECNDDTSGQNSMCCEDDVTEQESYLYDKIKGKIWEETKFVDIVYRKGPDWPHLNHFCLDETEYKEDTVIWCGCCIDHLIHDPKSKAALLFGSKMEKAPAFNREGGGKTAQVGLVNVWSLGGRIPAVVCDRGSLQCHCEDPITQWAEFEPGCMRGQNCSGPSETMFEEGASKGTFKPPDLTESADAKWPECSSDKRPRTQIGGAFCEDIALEHCEKAYSRSKAGHNHLCQTQPDMFRRCGAQLMSQAEAQTRTDEAQSWAIQKFYSPDRNWKVETEKFSTTILEQPLPEGDIFEDEVHSRMMQQVEENPNRAILMKLPTKVEKELAAKS